MALTLHAQRIALALVLVALAALVGIDTAAARPQSSPSQQVGTVTLPDVPDQTFQQGDPIGPGGKGVVLPQASGGEKHPLYFYTLTPDGSKIGLSLDEKTRKLTGTPTSPLAKTTFTYTATEAINDRGIPDFAEGNFTIGVRPKRPTSLTATAGEESATLNWDAISGVSG